MDMYLLLRNNKQSGPYSSDDLKSMGLKAYDLVWSEGKSAAWRYPSEIAELSEFAPAVEEQPFDRFYKKPAASSSAAAPAVATAPAESLAAAVTSTTSLPPIAPAATPAPATPVYTSEPSAVPGKRIIYVTMPASRTAAPVVREIPRELHSEAAPVREITREQAPVRETARPAPVETAPVVLAGAPDPAHLAYALGGSDAPAAPFAGRKTTAYASPGAEDYSGQLPTLEQQLEAVSPRRRRQQGQPVNKRVLRPLAIGVSILALLAAGIFIGLSLNKTSIPFSEKIASKSPDKNTDQSNVHPSSQQLPVTATNPNSITTAPGSTTKKRDSVPEIIEQPAALVPPVTKRPHSVTAKEKPAASKKGVVPAPTTKDSAAGTYPNNRQREAVRRTDIVETKSRSDNNANVNANVEKEAVRTTLANQVSVGANGYTVGTFGGINDLQLTVTNRSVHPLDLVVVEVQFIQANKKVYKTENLYFRNIGAGSALMQEAPKSSRGIKAQYKIITISSKDLGQSYSGI
jgi:hypothetical protein